MSPRQRLDAALKRLTTALDFLDAAAARRADSAISRGDIESELAVVQDDRARLAQELDIVTARARQLESANVEVARRLETAGVHIRTMIDANSGASGPVAAQGT